MTEETFIKAEKLLRYIENIKKDMSAVIDHFPYGVRLNLCAGMSEESITSIKNIILSELNKMLSEAEKEFGKL